MTTIPKCPAAANSAGLRIDIQAPTPETPSMTMALEKYISEVNKK